MYNYLKDVSIIGCSSRHSRRLKFKAFRPKEDKPKQADDGEVRLFGIYSSRDKNKPALDNSVCR